MSCNRQCFAPDDSWFEHEDCTTCSGKDDGATPAEAQWRRINWTPHAEVQPSYEEFKNNLYKMGKQ